MNLGAHPTSPGLLLPSSPPVGIAFWVAVPCAALLVDLVARRSAGRVTTAEEFIRFISTAKAANVALDAAWVFAGYHLFITLRVVVPTPTPVDLTNGGTTADSGKGVRQPLDHGSGRERRDPSEGRRPVFGQNGAIHRCRRVGPRWRRTSARAPLVAGQYGAARHVPGAGRPKNRCTHHCDKGEKMDEKIKAPVEVEAQVTDDAGEFAFTIRLVAGSAGQALIIRDHNGSPVLTVGPFGGPVVWGDRLGASYGVFGPELVIDGGISVPALAYLTSAHLGNYRTAPHHWVCRTGGRPRQPWQT